MPKSTENVTHLGWEFSNIYQPSGHVDGFKRNSNIPSFVFPLSYLVYIHIANNRTRPISRLSEKFLTKGLQRTVSCKL